MVDTDSWMPGYAELQTVKHHHAQFKFHTLSDRQPMYNVPYCIAEMLSHFRLRAAPLRTRWRLELPQV